MLRRLVNWSRPSLSPSFRASAPAGCSCETPRRPHCVSYCFSLGCWRSPAWSVDTHASDAVLEEARELRLRGRLEEAQKLLDQQLRTGDLGAADEVSLRLELARVHDRFGLHFNTRPVSAALEQIERAQSLCAEGGPRSCAQVELAFGYYHYRAETPQREFPLATPHSATRDRGVPRAGRRPRRGRGGAPAGTRSLANA